MASLLTMCFPGIPFQGLDYGSAMQKRLDVLGPCLLCDERFRFPTNIRTELEVDEVETTRIHPSCMDKLDRYLTGEEQVDH